MLRARGRASRTGGLCAMAAVAMGLGCAGTAPAVDTAGGSAQTPGVDPAAVRAELATLVGEVWEAVLADSPTWATALGDRRFDDRLPDLSEAAHARSLGAIRAFLSRAQAIDRTGLGPRGLVSLDLLETHLGWQVANEVCHDGWWDVDHIYGFHVWLPLLPRHHTIRNEQDASNLVTRMMAVPRLVNQQMANLERGMGEGYVAPRIAVDRTIPQLDTLLKSPVAALPFITHLSFPESWDTKKRAPVVAVMESALTTAVMPAFRRYRAFLVTRYLDAARAQPGVSALPQGAACYAARIVQQANTTMAAQEIHDRGHGELARIRGEMTEIMKRVGGADDLTAFLSSLRTRKDLGFQTEDELVETARDAVKRATAALPTMFGRLPKTPIVVEAMEAFRAPHAPAAFYHSAPDDGSRPATYYINTHALDSRRRHVQQALAYHEAVPGHHLQISLAKELEGVPDMQRHMGANAFVEGWALYAELLSDEMGLYSDDLSRFGMLDYQAWRAIRLVVDTGLHALGWSREKAVQFMMANSSTSQSDAEIEIDRYTIWPGQALGYMIGRMEIQRLRADATARLGRRFDLRAFHDEILRYGSVPLDVLGGIVERWIASQ